MTKLTNKFVEKGKIPIPRSIFYVSQYGRFSLVVSEVSLKTFDNYGNPISTLYKLKTMLSTDSSHA